MVTTKVNLMEKIKTYKISTTGSGIEKGLYNCISSFMSYPFITIVDNYDMTDDELCDWLSNEVPYILEVYEKDY